MVDFEVSQRQLGLDFTALNHLYLSVAIYMYSLALKYLLFGFYKVIGKILIDLVSWRTLYAEINISSVPLRL